MLNHYCCQYCDACFDDSGASGGPPSFIWHFVEKHLCPENPSSFYCRLCRIQIEESLGPHVKHRHPSKCIICLGPLSMFEKAWFGNFIHYKCCNYVELKSHLKLICDVFGEPHEYYYNFGSVDEEE